MTPATYASEVHHRLTTAYRLTRTRLDTHHRRQKDLYDKSHPTSSPFQAGDNVWLHCPAVKPGLTSKLAQPWTGPYRVVKRINDVTYRILRLTGPAGRRSRMVVHSDRLKLCRRLPPDIDHDAHEESTPPEATRHVSASDTDLEPVDATAQLYDVDDSFVVLRAEQPANGRQRPARQRTRPRYLADYELDI